MKAVVITVLSIPESVAAAQRCIASAATFGLEVEMFPAFIPADDPMAEFERRGWPTVKFTRNHYSRPMPCMSAFISHGRVWERCFTSGEEMVCLEHDAVMVRKLPDCRLALCANLGKPSFGRWKQPTCGVGPLVSKAHFPGAHAYFLHPGGAGELLRVAKQAAEPTDVFLSRKRFLWLKEAFPYSFECHEDFSTIQNPAGCQAKHRPVTIV